VHYIRAELVQWDYAPGGLVDQCTGQPLDAETAVRILVPFMSHLCYETARRCYTVLVQCNPEHLLAGTPANNRLAD
jgi:hypothetical protein